MSNLLDRFVHWERAYAPVIIMAILSIFVVVMILVDIALRKLRLMCRGVAAIHNTLVASLTQYWDEARTENAKLRDQLRELTAENERLRDGATPKDSRHA